MRYEIHPQVVCESVAGRYLLIAYGEALKELPYLREINETGAFFWELADLGNNWDEMLEQALAVYDAPPGLLESGMKAFFSHLAEKGYVKERKE